MFPDKARLRRDDKRPNSLSGRRYVPPRSEDILK
jgi:hypothetical protein